MKAEVVERDLREAGFEPVSWTAGLIRYLEKQGWTLIASRHPGAVLVFRDLRVTDRPTTVCLYAALEHAADADDFRRELVSALSEVAGVEGRNWVWLLRDVADVVQDVVELPEGQSYYGGRFVATVQGVVGCGPTPADAVNRALANRSYRRDPDEWLAARRKRRAMR